MKKFQATYRVTVYSKTETVTVEYPITCKFTVSRGLFCQSNKANIQLYNLSLSTRNIIFQDCFTIDPAKFKYVRLEAGYDNTMSVIFEGRILQAYSHKSGGQTDVITEIQAQALDIFDYQSSTMFEAGTSFKDAFKTLASDLPNVKLNNLGDLEGNFKTNTSFDGNTFEQLNKLTGGHSFVDNNMLNCLMDNEAAKVPVPVINDSSILLETPRRRDANLQIKMLFEPTLIVGQLLEIGSRISPNFNGQFKVIGFTHDCLISGTQSGSRITSVDLFIGPLLPGADINLTGEKIENGSSTGSASSFNLVEGENIEPVAPTGVNPKWIWPCYGEIVGAYGEPRADHTHNGIDISVPIGTPIKAIADGKVVEARRADGYGKFVVIEHTVNGKPVTSEYGHISRWIVSPGQWVKQGTVIAYSGNEGYSEGPHCHLTIRQGKYQGKAVNPWLYINSR